MTLTTKQTVKIQTLATKDAAEFVESDVTREDCLQALQPGQEAPDEGLINALGFEGVEKAFDLPVGAMWATSALTDLGHSALATYNKAWLKALAANLGV